MTANTPYISARPIASGRRYRQTRAATARSTASSPTEDVDGGGDPGRGDASGAGLNEALSGPDVEEDAESGVGGRDEGPPDAVGDEDPMAEGEVTEGAKRATDAERTRDSSQEPAGARGC